MALDAGTVEARLRFLIDQTGFDQFVRMLRGVRGDAQNGATANLGAGVDRSGFDDFDTEVRRRADAGATAGLGAEVDESGFKRYDEALGDAEGNTASFVGGIKTTMKVGLAAAAAAGAAALVAGFKGALERESATNQIVATLGISPQQAGRIGAAAGKVYADNFGDSFEEVRDTASLVFRNFGRTALSDEELRDLTARFETVKGATQADAEDIINTAQTLVANGLVPTTQGALDIILRGFQLNADKSGEFLDSLSEYAEPVKSLGLSAQDFTGQLLAAQQQGVFSIDKIGDALKEFSIRSVDGSDATKQAFKDLGLDADTTAEKLAGGGPKARKTFDDILKGLSDVHDPVKREQDGVALFGSLWEDIGGKVITGLRPGRTELDNFHGSVERAGNATGNALTPVEILRRKLEQFGRDAFDASLRELEQTLGDVSGFFSDLSDDAEDGGNRTGRAGRAIIDAVRDVEDTTHEVLDDVRKWWDEYGDDVEDAAQVTGRWLQRIAKFWNDYLREPVTEIAKFFGNQIRNISKVVGDLVGFVGAILSGDWQKAWDRAKDFVGDTFKAITEIPRRVIGAIRRNAGDVGRAAYNGLGDGLRGIVDFVGRKFGDILSYLRGLPAKLRAAASALGDAVIGGMRAGFEAAPGVILDVGKWLGGKIVDGIIEGIKSAPGSIAGAIKGRLGDIGSGIGNLIGDGLGAIQVAQGIRGGPPGGVGSFDGRPVASWMVPALAWAREHGWHGSVSSGYRSFEEQSAIYATSVANGTPGIQPNGIPVAVPGTSNHEGSAYPRGAVDVSDPQGLIRALSGYAGLKPIWFGNGDPVHFSGTGRARGGWFGARGMAGPDDTLALVAQGEAVLNRHQVPFVDRALRAAFGFDLDGLFSRVAIPHFSKGGVKGSKPVGSVGAPSTELAPSVLAGMQRSAARGDRGITKIEGEIADLRRHYGQVERDSNRSDEQFLNENDDGSISVNFADVARRIREIDRLRQIQFAIRSKLVDYRNAATAAVRQLLEAAGRLRGAMGAARGKTRPVYAQRVADYARRAGELRGVVHGLGFDLEDSRIDLLTLADERAEVAGVRGSAAAAGADVPLPDTGGSTPDLGGTVTPTTPDAPAVPDFTAAFEAMNARLNEIFRVTTISAQTFSDFSRDVGLNGTLGAIGNYGAGQYTGGMAASRYASADAGGGPAVQVIFQSTFTPDGEQARAAAMAVAPYAAQMLGANP